MNKPQYPHVKVALIGTENKPFYILGRVAGSMKVSGINQSTINLFLINALSKDRDHLLKTVAKTVTVK